MGFKPAIGLPPCKPFWGESVITDFEKFHLHDRAATDLHYRSANDSIGVWREVVVPVRLSKAARLNRMQTHQRVLLLQGMRGAEFTPLAACLCNTYMGGFEKMTNSTWCCAGEALSTMFVMIS